MLPDKLDFRKSLEVAEMLNCHRVWPEGISGIYKRLRFVLRIKVKSAFFDNLLTFFVLLNTIALSLNSYGMMDDLEKLLEKFNNFFTWVFIYEMFSKILAIGMSKYWEDKMNYIDGTVVLLSIFEMVFTKIVGSGGDLSALNTLRVLRALRVFRIARLLRSLQSMQQILGVIIRSYKSFVYITLLMLLFVFIFSLLGMSSFGGAMTMEDGTLPRGNYDSFPNAAITVF